MHLSSKNLSIASISMLWIRSTMEEIKDVIVGTGEAVTLLSRRQFQTGFFNLSSTLCTESPTGMVQAQFDIPTDRSMQAFCSGSRRYLFTLEPFGFQNGQRVKEVIRFDRVASP